MGVLYIFRNTGLGGEMGSSFEESLTEEQRAMLHAGDGELTLRSRCVNTKVATADAVATLWLHVGNALVEL